MRPFVLSFFLAVNLLALSSAVRGVLRGCGGSSINVTGADGAKTSNCTATILTAFLTARPDWIRKKYVDASFKYMSKFYYSVLAMPKGSVRAIVFHDGLPEDLIARYSTPDFSFVMTNRTWKDDESATDARFVLFREKLAQHPEWDPVFATDLADVELKGSPCGLVAQYPEKLFIGSEEFTELKPNQWILDRFAEMGGRYLDWYKNQLDPLWVPEPLWNAGIIGGKRSRVLELFSHMAGVIEDPALAARQHGSEVHIDMGALNWVIHNLYNKSAIVTGHPLHSSFKSYDERPDAGGAVFKHKLFSVVKGNGTNFTV